MRPVPFLHDKRIKREADDLIRQCQSRCPEFQPPFSLDILIYDYLYEADDLTLDTETSLGDGDGDGRVVGKTIPHQRLILIDPACVGQPYYRFTLAHEIGHWILHARPLLAAASQPSLFGDDSDFETEFVTLNRTVMSPVSAAGAPEEIQANKFASHLLMPQELVEQEFRSRFGQTQICARDSESELDAAREAAARAEGDKPCLRELFDVSRESMAYRLIDLRLVTGKVGFL